MRQIPLSIFGRNAKLVHKDSPVSEEPEKEEIVKEEPVVTAEQKPVETELETVTTEVEEQAQETLNDKPVTETVSESEPEEPEIESSAANESKEESKEETEEPEEKEEPKKKRTRKTVEKPAEINASMKMTGATKLMDAVALVIPEYEDPTYAEFMEHMNEALLHTVFDERADAGVIKVILSNLARCYDNATRKYAEVSAKLEAVANKNYGLIVRQTAANSIGSNEAERKRNGLHAPEIYKGSANKTVNLFAVEAGLRKEALELQTIIKQIEFKKSAIIAYLTASKQDTDV